MREDGFKRNMKQIRGGPVSSPSGALLLEAQPRLWLPGGHPRQGPSDLGFPLWAPVYGVCKVGCQVGESHTVTGCQLAFVRMYTFVPPNISYT